MAQINVPKPRVLFTADSHFGHENIIEHCNRPFADADEMDEAMIEAWNAVVRPTDIVHHLGDFGFKLGGEKLGKIFKRLHGEKHLIRGNHDKPPTLTLGWASVRDFNEVAVDGQRISLSHYGMRVWPGMRRGAIMLYGHSHGTLPGSKFTHDVGVDAIGYSPVDIHALRAIMSDLPARIYDDGQPIPLTDDNGLAL